MTFQTPTAEPTDDAAPRWRTRLFGQFGVWGRDGAANLGPKLQALFALLACAPDGRRSRTWLQARLWSEAEAAKAAANLRMALTTLRRALGERADALMEFAVRPFSCRSIEWRPDQERVVAPCLGAHPEQPGYVEPVKGSDDARRLP